MEEFPFVRFAIKFSYLWHILRCGQGLLLLRGMLFRSREENFPKCQSVLGVSYSYSRGVAANGRVGEAFNAPPPLPPPPCVSHVQDEMVEM